MENKLYQEISKCPTFALIQRRIRLGKFSQIRRRSRNSFYERKNFHYRRAHNHQNDRIWFITSPLSDKIVSRSQHPQSIMAWVGICRSGKTPLIFVDPEVKINKIYYLREIPQKVLEPWARAHFGNRQCIFQQDSAPAHKARKDQAWCQGNLPGFITSQEWPPYSPI